MSTEEKLLKEVENLKEEVRQLQEIVGIRTREEIVIEKTIREILDELMIKQTCNGYKLIIDAVKIILEADGDIMMTKELYPEVAKKNKTTSERVERAIRYCLESVTKECNNEYFTKFFPCYNGKLTNGEFLYRIADYIKIFC